MLRSKAKKGATNINGYKSRSCRIEKGKDIYMN